MYNNHLLTLSALLFVGGLTTRVCQAQAQTPTVTITDTGDPYGLAAKALPTMPH